MPVIAERGGGMHPPRGWTSRLVYRALDSETQRVLSPLDSRCTIFLIRLLTLTGAAEANQRTCSLAGFRMTPCIRGVRHKTHDPIPACQEDHASLILLRWTACRCADSSKSGSRWPRTTSLLEDQPPVHNSPPPPACPLRGPLRRACMMWRHISSNGLDRCRL